MSNKIKTQPDMFSFMSLLPGDMLFHHAHSHVEKWQESAFHCSIVGPIGHLSIVDSMPGIGVRIKSYHDFRDACVVFRAGPSQSGTTCEVAQHAAEQAQLLLESNTGYGNLLGRACLSAVIPHNFSSTSRKRLMKYHNRENKSPTNVFCSELLIHCYQMGTVVVEGADDFNINSHFINRDAKHTTPWDLEDYLIRHPSQWKMIGRPK